MTEIRRGVTSCSRIAYRCVLIFASAFFLVTGPVQSADTEAKVEETEAVFQLYERTSSGSSDGDSARKDAARALFESLQRAGTNTIPFALKLLSTKEMNERQVQYFNTVAEVLGSNVFHMRGQLTNALLSGTNPYAAAFALSKDNDVVVHAFNEARTNGDEAVRFSAASFLFKFYDSDAITNCVDGVINDLNAENVGLRNQSIRNAEGIGLHHGETRELFIDALLRRLDDENDWVSMMYCIRALWRLGEHDANVRSRLKRLGESQDVHPRVQRLLDELLETEQK